VLGICGMRRSRLVAINIDVAACTRDAVPTAIRRSAAIAADGERTGLAWFVMSSNNARSAALVAPTRELAAYNRWVAVDQRDGRRTSVGRP
jgi:hypothetical protein